MSEPITTDAPLPDKPKPKPKPKRKRPPRMGEYDAAQKQYQAKLAKAIKLRWQDHMVEEDIGKVIGVAQQTVSKMLAPFKPMLDDPEAVKQFKSNEPQLMDGIRMLMVQGMHTVLTDPKRVAKMDLSRFTYGYGIMYDKARLERGESTANVKMLSDLIRSAHATPVESEEAEIAECEKPSTPPSS